MMQHCGDDGSCPDQTALNDLRVMQRNNPMPMESSGWYLRCRRRLVNWVANVCTRFSLKPLTVHVAVQHMDRVLLLATLPEPEVKRFALAAIMLAAKMEESPDAVPLVTELQQVEDGFTSGDLQEIELKIMKFLDWRLQGCTYLHFLNIHINQGVLCAFDLLDGRPVQAKEESYLIKYIFFYADICVLESDCLYQVPGLISAAIIGEGLPQSLYSTERGRQSSTPAAARHTVGVEPVWPAELHAKTSYSANEICESVSRVISVFCRDFPASVPPQARARITDLGSPTTVDVSAQMSTPSGVVEQGTLKEGTAMVVDDLSSSSTSMRIDSTELFTDPQMDVCSPASRRH